jgi:hypothetical protein
MRLENEGDRQIGKKLLNETNNPPTPPRDLRGEKGWPDSEGIRSALFW